jgi:hypothetical protein
MSAAGHRPAGAADDRHGLSAHAHTVLDNTDDALTTSLQQFMRALPVDDAAVSSLAAPFDVETLAATSIRAWRCDEASIDMGEGPAWEAYHRRRPVEMRQHDERSRSQWPFFAASPTVARLGSILALPLTVGSLRIGAVSLYSEQEARFDSGHLALSRTLATALAQAVLARALDEAATGATGTGYSHFRREVHQATGMVIAQLGCTPAEALLRIRGHAFATSSTVRDVADAVLSRRLDFITEEGRTVE